MRRLEFLIVVISLLGASVAQSADVCAAIFDNVGIQKETPRNQPTFKLIHEDFYEQSEFGPTYINPTNSGWKIKSEGLSKFKSNKPGKNNLENEAHFTGAMNSKGPLPFIASSIEHIGAATFLRPGEHPPTDDLNAGLVINTCIQNLADGVRFQISSKNPDLIYTLIFSFQDLQGKPLWVETDFQVGEQTSSIFIPWSEFKFIDERSLRIYDLEKGQMAIALRNDRQKNSKKEKSKKISLTLSGPISFEANLQSKLSSALGYLKSINFSVPRDHRERVPYDGRNSELDKKLIDKIIQNLFNPSKQIQALKFAKKGRQAVFRELSRLGFGTEVFDKKFQRSFFFAGSKLNFIFLEPGQHSFKYEAIPRVPLEEGDFSEEHGALSHALQIIAITRGMSDEELDYFRKFYGSIFGPWDDRWRAWDILFDSTGNTQPTSPFFWRDLTESLDR